MSTIFDRVPRGGHAGELYFNPPLPTKPTTARPGTRAKVAVMCGRILRGEALHHPLDLTTEPTSYDKLRDSDGPFFKPWPT